MTSSLATRSGALDPTTALQLPGIPTRSTVYYPDHLLVAGDVDIAAALPVLDAVAAGLGLKVQPEERPRRLPHDATAVRLLPRGDDAVAPPDAWSVLQRTRARFGVENVRGVGLDHLLVTNGRIISVPWQPSFEPVDPDLEPSPQERPTAPHPEAAAPPGASLTATPDQAQIAEYVQQGSGGRQPVAQLGPAPPRRPHLERRPVVAVLDTGCGRHPWLDPIVIQDLALDGEPVGLSRPEQDPEVFGSLDDLVDAAAGHGTFMAGLVHLFCPDADLVAIRVVDQDGVVSESTLVHALAQIIELAHRVRTGVPGGRPFDVVVLPMGYYHETDVTDPFVPLLAASVEALGRLGVAVVAAAGNDSTSRPMYPAAFAPWADGTGPIPTAPDTVPVVSVGATNPDGTTALFSNDGPWVRAWQAGASVVSTMPVTFRSGLPTTASQVRSAIDPNDFSSGFAVWSGTSFAAAAMAGLLASRMTQDGVDDGDVADAVRRAWEAVQGCTTIAR